MQIFNNDQYDDNGPNLSGNPIHSYANHLKLAKSLDKSFMLSKTPTVKQNESS